MAVFLTGGPKAQTALGVASHLEKAGIPYLYGSRTAAPSPNPSAPSVKFDLEDPTTYSVPFSTPLPNNAKITATYLVIPKVPDAYTPLKNFVEYAKKEGVKRFVIIGGTTVTYGGGPGPDGEQTDTGTGKLWKEFDEDGTEYAVLRPTWFMDNFKHGGFSGTIKSQNSFASATGDGRIPYISVEDISEVAFHALTDEKPHNDGYRLVGAKFYTHDEIASIFSKVLNRKITHQRVSVEEREKQYAAVLPEFYAKILTGFEVKASLGGEEGHEDMLGIVEKITGRKAQSFDEFVEKNRAVWE